ncbi:putative integral membrane protein, Mpv17/PMP22 family [Myriangium duriaei CBS 260.36]|uniref:Integral membrane protein, Mpv17/PMP22 family n=1 Tax=Myriangium duriaei CBS 260.36 TaxID=1168546 RepID=A0A9P4J0Q4_9PEZI|nr:putative integral membrane protein, Mpv17/PMP22 family [Myriangium duriaei CBS 260.36]
MLEDFRRRSLRQLNSKYIYGKYPLLHLIIFVVELIMVSLLVRRFNTYYANRPVLTTMITNAVLGGIADTVAQTVTAVTFNSNKKLATTTSGRGDFFNIEIQDLDRKSLYPDEDSLPPYAGMYKRLPPPFDFERLTRFMAYGFLMAPVQHKWFGFLSSTFPLTKTAATSAAMKRVAFDQLLFAPVGLAMFFTFMTIAEGGTINDVKRKFQDVYIPALKANFMVWPAVQMLNFRVIPIQFQIPFVSTIGIAWTAYLSLTNSSDEA